MKMKHLSLFVALGFALTALASPAFAADKDKDKKASATPTKTTLVSKASPKTSVPTSKPVAPVEEAKTTVDAAKQAVTTVGTTTQALSAGTTALPVGTAKMATPAQAAPAPAPVAQESSSFFGGLKKFFGKSGTEAPAQVPASAPAPIAASEPSAGPASMPPRFAPHMQPPEPPSAPSRAVGPEAAASSFADELSARQKSVDSKAFDKAESVAKLFDVKERLKGSLSGMVMMLTPMLNRENEGQMDKIQKSISTAIDKIASDKVDLVIKNKAIFLAQTFTADELSQLEKFYESPVGQKFMKTSDDIARNDSMFMQRISMTENQKTREAVLKEVKRNDLKIPKGME